MEKAKLSGKSLMAYEAIKKIIEGERLMREGEIELANLLPEPKKIVNKTANKIVRAKNPIKIDSNKEKIVLNILKENEWGLTGTELSKISHTGWYSMKTIIRDLLSSKKIVLIKKRNNPKHKQTIYYNREYAYFVAV